MRFVLGAGAAVSFVERARELEKWCPGFEKEELLNDCRLEILSVVEAAQQVEASNPGQENWAELGNRLDALDKKADAQ